MRENLRAQAPELLKLVANVMFTRIPGGMLLFGGSHVYGRTIPPFLEEDTTARLLAEIRRILGAGPTPTQRWQGVYAPGALTSLVVERVDPRLTAIAVASGIGMTLCFGIAAQTLGALGVREPTSSAAR